MAPLALVSPESVRAGDKQFADGQIELAKEDVGPYLRARANDSESDLNRMNRQRLLWEAWINKVAASGEEDAVPSEVETGIGRFVTTLAKGQGDVAYATIPVTGAPPDANGVQGFVPDGEGSRPRTRLFPYHIRPALVSVTRYGC